MIKRRIAAAVIALTAAAAAPGCGVKNIRNPAAVTAADSASADVPPAQEGADQQDAQSGGGATSGADTDTGKKQTDDLSGGSSVLHIKRAEVKSKNTVDLKALLENSEELIVMISMDPVTDYMHAAEVYQSLGGKIKVLRAPKDSLFDQIEAQNASGRHVDIVQFDNGMMFPYGITEGLVEPVENAVDLSAERWDDCRELSKAFMLNNWHYAAVFGCSAKEMLFYNKGVISANGLPDPAQLYKSEEWTMENFSSMLRKWKAAGGKCGIAGHDWEQCLSMATGQTIIRFDKGCDGFSNNAYNPYICVMMNYIYGLKSDGAIGDISAYDADSAFSQGALFWSGTYEEAGRYSDLSKLGVISFPTLGGTKDERCYNAEYDGLVLMSGVKDSAAAGAFFECAREESHELKGNIGKAFTPKIRAVYEYGAGISPRISDSLADPDPDHGMAIIPLFYAAGPEIGEWDNYICYKYSATIHSELTKVNNAIADKVFGRSKEKETKKEKKKTKK